MLTGSWTVLAIGELALTMQKLEQDHPSGRPVIDGSNVAALATVGAMLIDRWLVHPAGIRRTHAEVEWRGWAPAHIDKDLCSGLLARQLEADCLVNATDVESVFLDWELPQQRAMKRVTPQSLASHVFAHGSMGPKVQAACDFVLATRRRAVIGSLAQIDEILAGAAGTQVCMDGDDL